MLLSSILKEYRRKTKITQVRLSKLLSVSLFTITQVENNRRVPKLRTLKRWAYLLSFDLSKLELSLKPKAVTYSDLCINCKKNKAKRIYCSVSCKTQYHNSNGRYHTKEGRKEYYETNREKINQYQREWRRRKKY